MISTDRDRYSNMEILLSSRMLILLGDLMLQRKDEIIQLLKIKNISHY